MSENNALYGKSTLPDAEQLFGQIKDVVSATVIDRRVPIDEHCDLLQMGVDSISMMKISGVLRKAGCSVSFADLIASPTLFGWKKLIEKAGLASDLLSNRHVVDADLLDSSVPFDLALMQHAYWIGRNSHQYLGGVAAHFYHEFDGRNIQPEYLDAAVASLLERHGMLRVKILDDGRQQIPESTPWAGLTLKDFRDQDRASCLQSLSYLREVLSHRQLDIGVGEVFDVQLTLLPDGVLEAGKNCRMHINLDMVAADAMSLRRLLADLAALYLANSQKNAHTLHKISISYPQYRSMVHQLSQTEEGKKTRDLARQYWQERLPDLPGVPQLPMIAGNIMQANKVVRRHLWLTSKQRRQFEQNCSQQGLTPALALASVLSEVLSQYSATQDFLLNLPLFNREALNDDVPFLVGDFTSSVLLSWQGSMQGSFVEKAQRLQQRFHQDMTACAYSGVEVLRDLSRFHGEQVFAPVVFTSALGLGDLFAPEVHEAFGEVSYIISQGPQVWLDAQVSELDGGLLINWDARESAFAPGILDDMFRAFSCLIDQLMQQDKAWQTEVASLLPADQVAERQRVNDTSAPLPTERLHEGFFRIAQQSPDLTAVLWGQDKALSYGALAEKALKLAAWLRHQGIEHQDLVGICLPKGPEQLIAVLGVLAVGAVYLPINVAQPMLRKEKIIASSGVRLMIEDVSLASATAPLNGPCAGAVSDLAYVLYTSGSTGEPKGVELSHLAAMNTIEDLNRRFAITAADRTLALSALDFDLSVFDMFSPLSCGGAVICIDEADRREALTWVELSIRHKATLLNCVPALADMLVCVADDNSLADLRLVLMGGDWVPLSLPEQIRRVAPQHRCVALGGTTETAIHSTVQEVNKVPEYWVSIPYGEPLHNVQCRVVDASGRDRPNLVPGELWIGGAGVAEGYRGMAQLSAERFVYWQGQRWYRTGDMARYLVGGQLEFLGRIDHQVKVNGNRIELGEVEAALLACPMVEKGVALLSQDGHLAVAYQHSSEHETDLAQVKAFLEDYLPVAMVPEHLLPLEALPLSANGKIDRQALRHTLSEQNKLDDKISAPKGEVEVLVATLWEAVLQLENIGREHNFFNLGGDSLQATRLIAALRHKGFSRVTLSNLFAFPILSEFAAQLVWQREERANADVDDSQSDLYDINIQQDSAHCFDPFPITDVQQAYLLGRRAEFTLGGTGCYFYREFEVEHLDVAALETALNRLIKHQDMLRAIFDQDGCQRILSHVPHYAIKCYVGQQALEQMRQATSACVFDPAQWPLFNLSVAQGQGITRVGIGIDNLILDALSILMFYQQLDQLYKAPDKVLDKIHIRFRDYMMAVDARPTSDSSLAWWQARLQNIPPAPQLPLAVMPSTIDKPIFKRRESQLDSSVWQALLVRARRAGVTPSAVLMAAYAHVLGRWSNRDDLTLNLTLFDRKQVHQDINQVFGDFTSSVLVSSRPVDRESWFASVQRMQQELWQVLDHRDVTSVHLIRELARVHQQPEMQMPVVFTSALGMGQEEILSADGLFSQHCWGLSQTPQVWLDHQVTEVDGGVCLTWDAVEALFPEDVLDVMFNSYLTLVNWVASNDWQQAPLDLLPKSQSMCRREVNGVISAAAERLLHEDFFALSQSHGDQPAVLFSSPTEGDVSVSYGQLSAAALRVANALRQAGLQLGQTVAVSLPKGQEQIVAVLGVLAAGGVYVPIGLNQPAARRQQICQRADCQWVLTDPQGAQGYQPHKLSILLMAEAMNAEPLANVQPVAPDQLAYIIFTSGSTGEPKGVEITHRAAMNTIDDINQRIHASQDDRVLALSALDFDLSVYDIFGLLSVGGALVLVNDEERREAAQWLPIVQRFQVTIWNTVPALLDMLLMSADVSHQMLPIRVAMLSGDWIGLDLPERLQTCAPGCRFFAMGGATEAAIWSNLFEVDQVPAEWRSVPYGYPLRNQHFRVVNHRGQDCPDFVTGELWIGGEGVALGYCGQPQLTAERFVLVEGIRWYRTGDLGRYSPEGCLEFLGRADQQIKLRGHRIELGEIEAALRQCQGVDQAMAMVLETGTGQQLVAAVLVDQPCADSRVTEEHLRTQLAAWLPSYMMPERVNIEDYWPLTENGKVDRKAVHKMLQQSQELVVDETPREGLESQLAELWMRFLGCSTVNRQSRFFALGGDSLLATRFLTEVQKIFKVAIPLRQMFAASSLVELAVLLDALLAEQQTTLPVDEEMEDGVL